MANIYWLASYPKSGNTWFRLFMSNLLKNGDEPVDINRMGEVQTTEIASGRGWLDDVLGFDTADLTQDEIDDVRPDVYEWSSRAGPITYHKIHDAVTVTSSGRPIISRQATAGSLYIIRNPLDVAISMSNHNATTIEQSVNGLNKKRMTLAENRVRQDSQVRQRLLSWSNHVRSWTERPIGEQLVIRYEDMLHDSQATFSRAAEFLKLPHDQEQVAKAIRHASFAELVKQESEKGFAETPEKAERFFRSGKTGDWRDKLTAEQIRGIVQEHFEIMLRYRYIDTAGSPIDGCP
jgi:Sulfotransferase domain